MAKQVLKITNWVGGLNAATDPRDIKDTEFAQNWNMIDDVSGVLRKVGGARDSIANVNNDNTNKQNGYGLFAFSSDYSYALIPAKFDNGIEYGTANGYASGTPSITLATTPTYTSTANHATDNYYTNWIIFIYEGEGIGLTKGGGPNTSSKYRIFQYQYGSVDLDSTNATALDHSSAFVDGIVTSATDANSNTVTSYENQSGYFLKSEVSAVSDNEVKNLGYIDLIKNGASTASNTLTLKPGTTYSLSFFARAKHPWHNFVSDGSNSENAETHGDRVPFIEIYSATTAKTENSVTTTGLYLQAGEDMIPVWTQGRAVSNHICHNFVDNGDFESFTNTTIRVNNGSDYAIGATAIVVDTTAATDALLLNKLVVKSDGTSIGVCTAVGSTTSITIANGITNALADDDLLYTVDGWKFTNNSDLDCQLASVPGGSSTHYYHNVYGNQGFSISMENTGSGNNDLSATGIRSGFISQTLTLEDNTWYCLNFAYAAVRDVASPTSSYNYEIGKVVCGAYIKGNKNQNISDYNYIQCHKGSYIETFESYNNNPHTTNNRHIFQLPGEVQESQNIGESNYVMMFVPDNVTGVLTLDNLTITTVNADTTVGDTISAPWEFSATYSTPFTQTSTTGNGTGLYVTATTNGAGKPTFAIHSTRKGTGYAVDDQIIFTDPGSSDTATVVIATIGGTHHDVELQFAPYGFGSSKGDIVKIDGISVHKSFPDLVTTSYAQGDVGSPYFSSITNDWSEYITKFTVPNEFSQVSDWVLRIHGGNYGFQSGAKRHIWIGYPQIQNDNNALNIFSTATGAGGDGGEYINGQITSYTSANNQELWLDNIRLTGIESADGEVVDATNMLMLSDNTVTESKIKIYTYDTNTWDDKAISWAGVKAQPVFENVNGVISISDANFDTNNNNLFFFFLNRKYSPENFLTDYSSWYTKTNYHVEPISLTEFEVTGTAQLHKSIYSTKMSIKKVIKYNYVNQDLDFGNVNDINDIYHPGLHFGGGSGDPISTGLGYQLPVDGAVKDVIETDADIASNFLHMGIGQPNLSARPGAAHANRSTNWDCSLEKVYMRFLYPAGQSDAGSITYDTEFLQDPDNDAGVARDGTGAAQAPTGGSFNNGRNPFYYVIPGYTKDGFTNNNKIITGMSYVNDSEGNSTSKYDDMSTYVEREILNGYDISIDETISVATVHIRYVHRLFIRHWIYNNSYTERRDKVLAPIIDITVFKCKKPNNQRENFVKNQEYFQKVVDSTHQVYTMTVNGVENHPVAEPATSASINNSLNPGATVIKKVTIKPPADNQKLQGWYNSDQYDWYSYYKENAVDISFDVGAINIFPNSDNKIYSDDIAIKFEVRYPKGSDGLSIENYFTGDAGSYDSTPYNQRSLFEIMDITNTKIDFYTKEATTEYLNQYKINDTSGAPNIYQFTFGIPSDSVSIGWEGKTFKLATSSVNLFGEESYLKEMLGTVGAQESLTSSIQPGECPEIRFVISKNDLKEINLSSLKFYLKDNELDIYYLICYITIEDMKIHSTVSNFKARGNALNNVVVFSIPREHLISPNQVDSYEVETQISQELAIKGPELLHCRYKTSVIANNRRYVGNIKQDGEVYGDRMIKSPINKYNVLPSNSFIDVAINDGDSITALAYYKDKLIQFKRNKVFVINTAGDYESLEDTFDSIGVVGPAAVVKTPYGIAWANEYGCFLYDGNNMGNLIDKKMTADSGLANYTNNYWFVKTGYNTTTNQNEYPTIGYLRKSRALIVLKSVNQFTTTSQPEGYEYSFITKSWTFLYRRTPDSGEANNNGNKSNFAIDRNGDLIWHVNYSTTLDKVIKWVDEGQNAGDSAANDLALSTFKTKDFDFGNPGVRKKIYKVYVTFKSADADGAAHSKVLVKFAINGSSSFTGFSTSTSTNYTANGLTDGGSSTDWITAELKPTSAINNVYSFQLEFHSVYVPSGFKINDISIVYRIKNPK